MDQPVLYDARITRQRRRPQCRRYGRQEHGRRNIGNRLASNEKGWTWTALRKINYYLANSHNCTDEAVRTKYDGVAYFFRAYFYYEKVLRYGDVPWYEQVIGSEEEELLKKPAKIAASSWIT